MPAKRPRHRRPDGETLIRKLEAKEWVFTKGKRYFKGRCACGKHQISLHVTPKNDVYFKHIEAWLRNNTCYGKGSKQ